MNATNLNATDTKWAAAVKRASTERLQIRKIAGRLAYTVVSTSGRYTVTVKSLAERTAHCECKGAQSGYMCKHVAAAFMYLNAAGPDGTIPATLAAE